MAEDDATRRTRERDADRHLAEALDGLVSSGYGSAQFILRHFSLRRFNAHLVAAGRRLHTERRDRWENTRLVSVAASGGHLKFDDLPEYPDYEDSEEEYTAADALAIEEALMASPFVIHAPPPPEAPPEGP